MATEERWLLFAARADQLGVGSMLSFHLFVEPRTSAPSTCTPLRRELPRTLRASRPDLRRSRRDRLIGARHEERLMGVGASCPSPDPCKLRQRVADHLGQARELDEV